MSTSKSADGALRTARLVLRGPKEHDLDAMHRVYSDPYAMRYWATLPHPDRATTKELLDRRIAHWAQQQTNFQITLDGAWIGNVGLFTGHEIGFMLDPAHHRKGYVSEALAVVLPAVFARTGHPRLMADIDPRNAASAATLRKFGFRETHRAKNTYLIGGVWFDSAYFALDRPT
ncbi:N-acetyltransferase [Salipiger sp. IMCC34102]|uniref:GNAT family N-acetyltransferase n=1 Tax=Salipiger sp. IMCC34102 TaxID=2510647 RepID=UPI00101DC8F2|nr:GNAT family N-acetyltransferase [Salipiger sp. IMCC34102]RYH03021.1 N-acetyltransferase [Salipiger sp. IMCC34102]